MVHVISSGESRDDAESNESGAGITTFGAMLTRHRKSAGMARDHLRKFLAEVPDGAALAMDGPLVLTELVSNAVVHGRVSPGREIAVRFELTCGHLRIEVHDASSEKPTIRRSTVSDELLGRGLFLVEALSVEWGCAPRPEGFGKIVWALVGPGSGAR
ncbi:ATP-binding protein [Kitasatospora sp. NPDC091276]|uniref:ATP-binding protein n=1 Tax=Kitasatospora sp. NPDC091276 TaxID=3155300 RepID=UPI0034194A06